MRAETIPRLLRWPHQGSRLAERMVANTSENLGKSWRPLASEPSEQVIAGCRSVDPVLFAAGCHRLGMRPSMKSDAGRQPKAHLRICRRADAFEINAYAFRATGVTLTEDWQCVRAVCSLGAGQVSDFVLATFMCHRAA